MRLTSVESHQEEEVRAPTGTPTSTGCRFPFLALIKPLFRALSNSGYRRGGSGEQRTRTILIAESPSNSDDGYQDTGPSSSWRNWVVSDENDETRGFSIKSPIGSDRKSRRCNLGLISRKDMLIFYLSCLFEQGRPIGTYRVLWSVRAGRIKAVYSSYPLAPEIRARWDERITFFLSEPPPPERRTKLEIISRLSFGEIVHSLSRVSFHSPWQSSDGVGIEASLGFDIESGVAQTRVTLIQFLFEITKRLATLKSS
ncbi:hypothetical protein HZH66_007685 [Vespula vulgaris]|uniref:Uncharacterized protein n=1 Tax=Vespula vulgaris TaxID=7454 RepID=A0A834JVR2_VESVU|nr:hypothetical protein HZH66_007685 [Vespula vulgaris]